MKYLVNSLIILVLAVGITHCKGSSEPSSASKNGNKYLKCAETGGQKGLEKINLPPLTIVRDGKDIKISGISNSIVSVGLLSGIHEITPETQKNIYYFLEQFRSSKVHSIVVTGGVGKTKNEIKQVLQALAKAPIPILVSPGAQESFGAFKEAFKELKKDHPQLINMTRVRRVFMKHTCFISLPGYFNPFYLEAKSQGCSYDSDTLSEIKDFVTKDKTHILISATPPRGDGPNAPDMGRGNVNIGDKELETVMAENNIQFGLFGHVYESGGNAIAQGKKEPLPKGIWHPSMYLQAGSADAVPVRLVNGGRTSGMAHIVDFSGHRARFKQILAL